MDDCGRGRGWELGQAGVGLVLHMGVYLDGRIKELIMIMMIVMKCGEPGMAAMSILMLLG